MYDHVEQSDTTKSYINKASARLYHMTRISGLKKQMLLNIATFTDFSYAWRAIDDFIPIIANKIIGDPGTVLLIKTVFTKLASIMNFPLKRMIERNSEEMQSVAKFYSGELVKFVKKTLSIIPTNIFEKLEEISVILTRDIQEVESKILKEKLRDFACFDQRYVLAKRTHEISQLTEGMLVLDKTLMGIIEIDPKEILVDGIRKELGRKLATMLHEGFIFSGAE
jgi:WASH complex subunit strumpellin